jgi:hypothetical protein
VAYLAPIIVGSKHEISHFIFLIRGGCINLLPVLRSKSPEGLVGLGIKCRFRGIPSIALAFTARVGMIKETLIFCKRSYVFRVVLNSHQDKEEEVEISCVPLLLHV